MTVGELITQLEALDPGMPVLAYYKESGGWVNGTVVVINPDSPRPYVVIRA